MSNVKQAPTSSNTVTPIGRSILATLEQETPSATAPRITARRRRGRRTLRRTPLRIVLLFLGPWGAGLLIWYGYPLVATIYYGLTNFNGIAAPQWVGLRNFQQILTQDPVFWTSVKNTLWWVGLNVPLSIVLALLLAIALSRPAPGLGIFRTVIYLPSMIPVAGATLLFLWLFNPVGGPVDNFSAILHGPTPGWFTAPGWSKPALLLESLWGIGGMMIIFLVALQRIPNELYEAATIDGASAWSRFWHVTLPGCIPAIFFNMTLGIVAAFTYFAAPLIVSSTPSALGGGGATTGVVGNPVNSTLTLSVYIYEQLFINFRFGYAAALSTILALAVIVFGGTLFLIGRRLAPSGED
jgi:multiple sugar transport system permease protein